MHGDVRNDEMEIISLSPLEIRGSQHVNRTWRLSINISAGIMGPQEDLIDSRTHIMLF
jgi:hypothetical protein